MFTPRFAKSVAGTALAAATLGMGALVAAGTAGATSTDDTFLNKVSQAGISVSNPEQVIKVGKAVCADLDAGTSKDTILGTIENKTNLSETQAKSFIVYSVQAYCPEYLQS